MIEDRGQLAVAGGQLPVASEHPSANASGLGAWILRSVSPDAVLGFADRHRRAIWTVTLFFYLAAFNGQWRIQPDAALYLSLGRNLATGRGFTYLGHPNLLAYPGWPAMIALVFKLFGNNSLLLVNILMFLISLATIGMVYRLFLIRSGRPTAVVMSVGVALTKAFFCYGFELWSDMPFALGAMSALAGYEGIFGPNKSDVATGAPSRKWLDASLLVGGIFVAASMRPTIWPLLAAFSLTFIVQAFLGQIRWGTFFKISAGVLAVAGAITFVCWKHIHGFGQIYEEYLFNRITGKSSDGMSHPFVANIRDLFGWAASDVLFQTRLGPVCNALLSMVVLGLGFGLFRLRLLWGFWFTFLLATIMVSQETLDRYFLPVLPLLVFAWWELLLWIYRTLKDCSAILSLPRVLPGLAFAGLLCIGCLMNLTKVGGIIVQQHELPFLANYDKGAYDQVPRFAKMLRDKVDNKSIVLIKAPYGRVTEYLSDRPVTGAMGVSSDQLQNRTVFVVEPSDLSIKSLLHDAGLVEDPALFTVNPSSQHGPAAVALSLHSTHPKNKERR